MLHTEPFFWLYLLLMAYMFYSYAIHVVTSSFSPVCLAVKVPEFSHASSGNRRVFPGSMSDDELVQAVCGNDQSAIMHMFYKKYLPTFQYHVYKLFPYKTDVCDLVDEFFLYLYEDDWRRLRTYDSSKASLSTWISVTSFRFFKNYKHSKIDSNGLISTSDKWESFVGDWVQSCDAGLLMDINAAIDAISNDRDREIARCLFIEDKEFAAIADEFGLTVDYIYTIKNRLIRQIRSRLDSYR